MRYSEVNMLEHIGVRCMIKFDHKGAFKKTKKFLREASDMRKLAVRAKLEALASSGVDSLELATPKRTGKTASSWSYDIEESDGKIVVSWINDNVVNGVNIAIILQYGHGTKNGGYVTGIDYINPALRAVFTDMTESMWKAVVSL